MISADGTNTLNLTVPPGKLKFGPHDEFHRTLRQRIHQYFEDTGLPKRDCPAMYFKTGLILAWFAASYALLVFCPITWWMALPLAVSLGLSVAAIGFNIQHDGSHGAYSERGWVNRLMALTLDLLGGSSYVWARKHNSIHHSYTNVTGHDDDINVGFLGRLSPQQPRHTIHRFQHLYMWVLYGFLPIKWNLFDDFRDVIRGRIGEHKLPRPKGWDLVIFVGGKAAFCTLAFAIPLLMHSFWPVLLFYLTATMVSGLVLSVVFQSAHCVEEASFPEVKGDPARIEAAWAVHQLETTVNFARRNKLLTWFVGGLNFQIEHHLFPQICHLHYAALAKLVEATSREFKLKYASHETFVSSVASHFRWLRRMGMPLTA
jgi:linoleoyl-CoA desaturase